MTYPDLIVHAINENGAVLITFAIMLILIALLILLLIWAFRHFIRPKINEFLIRLEHLISRVEGNEREIQSIKLKMNTDYNEMNTNVKVDQAQMVYLEKTIERVAEMTEKSLSGMQLMVMSIKEYTEALNDTITTLRTEHNLYHKQHKINDNK